VRQLLGGREAARRVPEIGEGADVRRDSAPSEDGDVDIWFPGTKQPLHLSEEDFRKLERVVLADQAAKEHDPEWERKLFVEFTEQHPDWSMEQLVKEFGKPYVWCWEKLHLFFLNELAAHCFSEGVLRPHNAMLLAQLRAEEQGELLKRAIKLPPADFRIVFEEFVRAKVRAVPVIVVTACEIAAEAIVAVPKLKQKSSVRPVSCGIFGSR
jgi:hypothetical protein